MKNYIENEEQRRQFEQMFDTFSHEHERLKEWSVRVDGELDDIRLRQREYNQRKEDEDKRRKAEDESTDGIKYADRPHPIMARFFFLGRWNENCEILRWMLRSMDRRSGVPNLSGHRRYFLNFTSSVNKWSKR